MISGDDMLAIGALCAVSMIIVAFVIYVRKAAKKDSSIIDIFVSSLNRGDNHEEGFQVPETDESIITIKQDHSGKNDAGLTDILASDHKKASLNKYIGLIISKLSSKKKKDTISDNKEKRSPLKNISIPLSLSLLSKKSKKAKIEEIDGQLEDLLMEAKNEKDSSKDKKKITESKSLFSGFGGIIGLILNRKGKSGQIKEIDDQLDNVLSESHNILADEKFEDKKMEITAKGESITDLEKSMHPGDPEKAALSPLMQEAGPGDFMTGESISIPEESMPAPNKEMSFESTDNLLSELEESTKDEKEVVLDILRGMDTAGITCEEIEEGLTEILERFRSRSRPAKKVKA